MKLKFETKNIDQALLMKMPSKEEMTAYKKSIEQWRNDKSSDIITPEPTPPEIAYYRPLEAVYLVFTTAIGDTYPSTQTKNIRNILRLMDTLETQCKTQEDTIDLDVKDVAFLQRCIAKATWKTDNTQFLKFVVSIENVLLQALNQK